MLRSEDNSTAMAQARLVELAQARDSAAFTTLYLLHTTGICGYLLGLVGNEEDAHDLAQQAFLQAWQKLSGLHDVARFTPWLYAIARNLAYDHSRQKKGASWSSWEDLEESQADVSEPGPEDQVAQLASSSLMLDTVPMHEALSVGDIIQDPAGGRYVIEALLGEGGSGAVYLVRDQGVGQQRFALKEVINPDKHDRERFTFEGQVLWRLEHKALPRVYRVFENDKLRRVYMLMDYIEGPNLEVLQKEQPEQRFPLALSLALLAPIVDALNYLHHQDPPIVHRDVKPANIIVPMKGEGAVLVDFGIAKEFVEDKTTNVIRHGSPGYAAPEQYGGGTNPQTDLYGLGATVYTMLTGVIPPDAITRATRSKSLDPLRPVNLLVPAIAPEVARAIEEAMSISIDDRFQTIEQFWQELQGTPTRERIDVVPTMPSLGPRSLPEQSWKKITTHPLQRERPKREGKRRGVLLPVLLALFISAVGAGSFLGVALKYGGPPPASSTVAPAKTPLFLTNIKQSGGTIQGSFQGLGLIGPFTGTVSTGGKVQFTVSVYGGNEILAFEGTIKIGGDIVGSFDALDPNGNKTGESGLWNVGPHP